MSPWIMWIILAVLAYAACGLLAFGITLAYWQRRYPHAAAASVGADVAMANLVAFLGPMGLLVAFLLSQNARYGLMWQVPLEGKNE